MNQAEKTDEPENMLLCAHCEGDCVCPGIPSLYIVKDSVFELITPFTCEYCDGITYMVTRFSKGNTWVFVKDRHTISDGNRFIEYTPKTDCLDIRRISNTFPTNSIKKLGINI